MSSLVPPLSRDDFLSDAAYHKYLNGLAALVELQFLHSRSAILALGEKPKNRDAISGAGAEEI